MTAETQKQPQGLRSRESLTAILVRTVAGRIRDGDYPRGSRLPTELQMIDEFGVSRTVVREAIANLRANGMVATRHGIGAFVLEEAAPDSFKVDEDSLHVIGDVVKALELRIGIESEAAALAARRRTEADLEALDEACYAMDTAIAIGSPDIEVDLNFHRMVATASGNDHFLNIFNYLGGLLIPRTRVGLPERLGANPAAYLGVVNMEHRKIVEAIRNRDAAGARAAMRLHLTGSRDRLIERMHKA